MKIEHGTFCPFVNGKCRMQKCMLFMQVRGQHPQTGEHVDEWDCALKWQVMLTMESTRAARGTQAATESFRNEMVRRADMPVRNHNQFDLIDDVINRQPQLIEAQ
jgi:hypothetical protein